MTRLAWAVAILALALVTDFYPAPVWAQTAPVTWVSPTGDDGNATNGNSCNAAHPCATFYYALTATASGGEVHCMGPYALNNGSLYVNITFSVTIDCHDGLGAIVENLQTFVINAPGATVSLRGLALNGLADTTSNLAKGTDGIDIQAAAVVKIEDCVIDNFPQAGISVTTSANTVLNIRNTTISNVANGISFAPTGGGVNGSIDRTMIAKASGDGITTNGGSVFFTVTNSVITNAAGVGVHSGGAGTVLGIDSSSVSNNRTAFATAGGVIRISRNVIYDNTTNYSISGGVIATAGNNSVAVNGSTVPNATVTQQ